MRIDNHSAEAPNNVEMKVNEYRTKSSGRVNINNLISRVRAEQKKQKKDNIVLVGLDGCVIVITGIIASL